MPGADGILFIGFLLVLAAPLFLYLCDKYHPPISIEKSLKEVGTTAGIFALLFVAFNVVRFNFAFHEWEWELAGGLAIGGMLRLLIDWLILRRQQGLEEE